MPVLNNYLNGGINATPGSLTNNIPSFTAYPPGVQGSAGPVLPSRRRCRSPRSSTRAWNPGAGAKNGTDFSWAGMAPGSCRWSRPRTLSNHGDVGLPGLYALGGMYDSSRFNRLADPGRTDER